MNNITLHSKNDYKEKYYDILEKMSIIQEEYIELRNEFNRIKK